MRATLDGIQPLAGTGEDALALLIGRPLALVRAALSIELLGGTAKDQSWAALQNRLSGATKGEDAGIGDMRFPVKLGKPGQMNDGLVACWTERNGATDYANVAMPAPDRNNAAVTPRSGEASVFVQAETTAPTRVTLLIDPRGVVHATTGVLPVKAIGLPVAHYRAAMARLEAAFRTGPVLAAVAPQSALSMVTPVAGNGEWSWCSADVAPRPVTAIDLDAKAPGILQQEILEGWLRIAKPSSH